MSRKKRKNKGQRSEKLQKALCNNDVNGRDPAVEDFANVKHAKEALRRLSRGFSSSATAIVIEAEEENMIPWYDRTDFDSVSDEEDEKPSSGNHEQQTTSTSTPQRLKRKTKDAPCTECNQNGLLYPLDVWCLLAQYIEPEDVQKFALICKGARQATNMRTFWLRIYKCYINGPKKLPERLQPDRIECRPGLRTRIIRALFYGYEPFRTCIVSHNNLKDPDVLEGHMCISVWCKQALCKKRAKKIWAFYFKFSQKPSGMKRKPRYFSKEWLAQVDDLNYNPEDGHAILQINCVNYLPVSPVQGHVLTKASIGVSRDMKHNSVKLVFHSPRSDGRYRKDEGKSIILEPAYDVKVVNWWSPLYPHCEDAL